MGINLDKKTHFDHLGPHSILVEPMAIREPYTDYPSSFNQTNSIYSNQAEDNSAKEPFTVSKDPNYHPLSAESGFHAPSTELIKLQKTPAPHYKKLVEIQFPNFKVYFNQLKLVPHLDKDRSFEQRAEKQSEKGLSSIILLAPIKREIKNDEGEIVKAYLEHKAFDSFSDDFFIAKKPEEGIKTVYVVQKSHLDAPYQYLGRIQYSVKTVDGQEETRRKISEKFLNDFLSANDRYKQKHEKKLYLSGCRETGLHFFKKNLLNDSKEVEASHSLKEAFVYLSRYEKEVLSGNHSHNFDNDEINFALGCCYLNRAIEGTEEEFDLKAFNYFKKNDEDFKSLFELACLKFKLEETPKKAFKAFKILLKIANKENRINDIRFLSTALFLKTGKVDYKKLMKLTLEEDAPSPWNITLLIQALSSKQKFKHKDQAVLFFEKYTNPIQGFLPAMVMRGEINAEQAQKLYRQALKYKHQYILQRDYAELVNDLFTPAVMKDVLLLKSKTGYDLEIIRQLLAMTSNVAGQQEENGKIARAEVYKVLDLSPLFGELKIDPYSFNLYQYDPLSSRTFLDLFERSVGPYKMVVSLDSEGKLVFFDRQHFKKDHIKEYKLNDPALFEWNPSSNKFEFMGFV